MFHIEIVIQQMLLSRLTLELILYNDPIHIPPFLPYMQKDLRLLFQYFHLVLVHYNQQHLIFKSLMLLTLALLLIQQACWILRTYFLSVPNSQSTWLSMQARQDMEMHVWHLLVEIESQLCI